MNGVRTHVSQEHLLFRVNCGWVFMFLRVYVGPAQNVLKCRGLSRVLFGKTYFSSGVA